MSEETNAKKDLLSGLPQDVERTYVRLNGIMRAVVKSPAGSTIEQHLKAFTLRQVGVVMLWRQEGQGKSLSLETLYDTVQENNSDLFLNALDERKAAGCAYYERAWAPFDKRESVRFVTNLERWWLSLEFSLRDYLGKQPRTADDPEAWLPSAAGDGNQHYFNEAARCLGETAIMHLHLSGKPAMARNVRDLVASDDLVECLVADRHRHEIAEGRYAYNIERMLTVLEAATPEGVSIKDVLRRSVDSYLDANVEA